MKHIKTVRELRMFLDTCADDNKLLLISECGDDDGFPVGGALNHPALKETWIIIGDLGEGPEMEWSGDGPSDDDELQEISDDEFQKMVAAHAAEVEKDSREYIDVVRIRGKLRSA